MHRLQIHTIDAFFMQMAQSFSLELGMTPPWQILEEGSAESNRLRADAIAGVLRQESVEDLLTLVHQIAPKGESKRSLDSTLVGSVNSAYRLFSTIRTQGMGFSGRSHASARTRAGRDTKCAGMLSRNKKVRQRSD